MKSFKDMIREGSIKRADAMQVRLDDLHEEPGFNLRREGEDLEQSIALLADHIMRGGPYPALEVRPRDEGGVWLVDGHRRRRALLRCREMGLAVEWVKVVAFTGDEAERVARIMTSAEGRELAPIEVAQGYKRLRDLGKTPAEIAQMVGKTRQHVDQLLILANATGEVQDAVREGKVSAAVAVKLARAHGEQAGEVLRDELDKAGARGKAKVTDGTMRAELPAKAYTTLVDELDIFMGQLPLAAREGVKAVSNGRMADDTMVAVRATTLARLLREHGEFCRRRDEQLAKHRAKAEAAKQQGLAA